MQDKRCFRAWDKKNHKWALSSNKIPFHLIGETTMFDLLNQYCIEEYGDLIIEEFLIVRDKNQTLICAGDYLKTDSGKIVEVKFNNILGCYYIGEYSLEQLYKMKIYDLKTHILNCELVGNIHEGVNNAS